MGTASPNIAAAQRSGGCRATRLWSAPRSAAGWTRFTGEATAPAFPVVSHTGQWSTIPMTAPCVRWSSRCCALAPTVWTCGADAIEERFAEAMAGAYVALDRLRSEGVVAGIGIGVNEAEMCVRFAQAGSFDTMLLAGRYSLLEQPALAHFLPLAQQRGIGVMLGGVFNSGILATGAVKGAKYNYQDAPPEILAKVARIERVCTAHGVALPTAALHFALGHPAVASVVLGAETPQEVERNVAGLSSAVPAALWSDLKAERLLDPDAPVPAVAG